MSDEVLFLILAVVVVMYVARGVFDCHGHGRKIDKLIDRLTQLVLLLASIYLRK